MPRHWQIASWSLALGSLIVPGCRGQVSLDKETQMLHDLRARREAFKPADGAAGMHAPTLFGEQFIRPPSVRETAGQALGRIGIDAVPALVKALSDPDAEVRSEAANALAIIGPKAEAAVAALTRLLADPDEDVRRSAAKALGQIGPAAEGAVPSLLKLLEQPSPQSAPVAPHRSTTS